MSDPAALTRGERNRNPGNVLYREEIRWLGQVPDFDRTDARFAQFDTDVYGIRALCRILVNYQKLDACKTLGDMVSRWAPPAENDTAAYIADVERRTGLAADGPVDLTRVSELATIARALITHENGRCNYNADTLNRAATMALA